MRRHETVRPALCEGKMDDEMVLFHVDGAAARRTVSRLSRAGFDGEAITFLAASEVTTAGRYADRQVDKGTARNLLVRAVTGGCIGAIVGVGPGMLLLATFAEPTWALLLAGAGAGGVFGWGIGVLLAFQITPTMVPMWERTFAPLIPGGVAVRVIVDSPKQWRRLRRVVRRSQLVAVLSPDEYRDQTA